MKFNQAALCRTLVSKALFLLIVVAVMTAAGSKAYAAIPCDAPWMHPGGQFVITSSSSKHQFTFDVLSFDKKDSDHCSGSIRTSTAFSVQGRSVESQSVFHVSLSNGLAQVQPQQDASGNLNGKMGAGSMNAVVSAQLSGFLSYAGEIKQAGQALPATKGHAAVNSTIAANGVNAGNLAASNMSFTTTERRVGQQEALDTVAGKLDCWPVSYDLTENPGSITFQGHTMTIPPVTQQIVDHYCPVTNLVMRKDITSNGNQVSQIVTSIK